MRPYTSPSSIKKGASAIHPVGYEEVIAATVGRLIYDLMGPDSLAQKDAVLWLRNHLEDWAGGYGLPLARLRQYILLKCRKLGAVPEDILDILEEDPEP